MIKFLIISSCIISAIYGIIFLIFHKKLKAIGSLQEEDTVDFSPGEKVKVHSDYGIAVEHLKDKQNIYFDLNYKSHTTTMVKILGSDGEVFEHEARYVLSQGQVDNATLSNCYHNAGPENKRVLTEMFPDMINGLVPIEAYLYNGEDYSRFYYVDSTRRLLGFLEGNALITNASNLYDKLLEIENSECDWFGDEEEPSHFSEVIQELRYPLLLEAVKKGESGAMVELGNNFMFYTKEDYKEEDGFKLFMKAHELGNIEGTINIAYAYKNGKGTELNLDMAIKYFIESAEKDSHFFTDVANIYFEKGDKENCLRFYEKAACKGSDLAMFHLGRTYESGLFTEKNIDIAKDWFEKARDAGNNLADAHISRLNERG